MKVKAQNRRRDNGHTKAETHSRLYGWLCALSLDAHPYYRFGIRSVSPSQDHSICSRTSLTMYDYERRSTQKDGRGRRNMVMRPHEFQGLLRDLEDLGRIERKYYIIYDGEIIGGEHLDNQQISTVHGGLIRIDAIQSKRVLDCGHVTGVDSVEAACSVCGRMVCSDCYSICEKCNILACRHCFRVSADEEGYEKSLCNSCYTAEKRRKTALKAGKAIFGFFVKREE